MNHRYYILGCLLALMGLIVSLSGCTDELEGGFKLNRPSDVICFTASLSDSRVGAISRGSSGHLAIEQEEWLVGVEKKQGISRGAPVTLLSGSAGVIGIGIRIGLDDNNTESVWSDNAEYVFDGDELTSNTSDVRWSTLAGNDSVSCYVYAPYNAFNISGKTINYQVKSTLSQQEDLIVASWTGVKDTDYGNGIQGRTIPLVFEHALTAVKFKVGFACTVTKLEVKGVYNSGTYTLGSGWTEIGTSTAGYTFNFDEKGAGKSFAANDALTDGDNILMMIPQTFSSDDSKVILTIADGAPIEIPLKGKVWQPGKMITYTIHKDKAPATIYFDLAAGNVELGKKADADDVMLDNTLQLNDFIYKGFVYVGGDSKVVMGKHQPTNQYYVYQSSASAEDFNKDKTGYANVSDFTDHIRCRIPNYKPVEYNGQSWGDYITNNTSVEDVIEVWDDGNFIREDGSSAPDEEHIGVKVVRDVGRTHTRNYIKVTGASSNFNLTIDDIYSVIQQPVRGDDSDTFRRREVGGIVYIPTGNSELTVNLVGDNRMGCLHIHNTPTDKITLQGTGTLTVADTDFLTVSDYKHSDYGDNKGYTSNFWNSAIGNNTDDKTPLEPYHENVYSLYINSGVIFAGTTKAEDCTAIGGGGNGFGQVYITGGTITAVATTAGTAIGGGMGHSGAGGSGEVHISGGNIYAYNFENKWHIPSSAIGGGSSYASNGQGGTVNIRGGYVYAYSDLGTAIGGGSSSTLSGGNANVSISGGQVIAKSGKGAGIGGGSSRTNGGEAEYIYNGGTATINISGDPIIRTGSIGGGITNDPKGKIGYAKISISGGDIQAQFVMAAGSTKSPEFLMSGGTIRNSNVGDNTEYTHIKAKGGAVYLEDGLFSMTGGFIKNCSAEQGGAVYIDSSKGKSTFEMSSGTIHSCFATGGENATKGHGGAVCLNGGQVLMTGGTIFNNYSVNGHGGAIYINNGNFTMRDDNLADDLIPTISGNSAQKGNGGGVFVSSEGSEVKVNLLHGLITGNSANNYGGGVCVDMGATLHAASVIVGKERENGTAEDNENPDVSNNSSMLSGGGLYVRGTNANIRINGGNIKGNQVSAYVKNENVANEGGEVTLNAELVTDIVKVTFVGNGGKIEGAETYEQKVVINTNSKLTKNQFVYGGKKFVCWNNRPDNLGDISYKDNEKINISNSITLYAIWIDQ